MKTHGEFSFKFIWTGQEMFMRVDVQEFDVGEFFGGKRGTSADSDSECVWYGKRVAGRDRSLAIAMRCVRSVGKLIVCRVFFSEEERQTMAIVCV